MSADGRWLNEIKRYGFGNGVTQKMNRQKLGVLRAPLSATICEHQRLASAVLGFHARQSENLDGSAGCPCRQKRGDKRRALPRSARKRQAGVTRCGGDGVGNQSDADWKKRRQRNEGGPD